jgi:hypothetical protein
MGGGTGGDVVGNLEGIICHESDKEYMQDIDGRLPFCVQRFKIGITY